MPADHMHNNSQKSHQLNLSDPISQFILFIESLPIPTCLFNEQGELAAWNPAASRWMTSGISPTASGSAACQFILTGLDGEILDAHTHPVLRTLQTGQDLQSVTVSLRQLNGSTAPIQAHTRLLRGASGHVAGVVCQFVEVTPQQPHTDLQSPNQQPHAGASTDPVEPVDESAALHDLIRERDQFLGKLVHELRNPLAPINNSLQVLALSKDVGRAVTDVRVVLQRQVCQLINVIDNAAEISRVMRGRLEVNRKPVAIEPIVKNVTRALRPLLDSSHLQLTLTCPPEPIHVEADATKLNQVVTNLLMNAIQHSKPNGSIWITVSRSDQEALLSVRDTGTGIAPADLERVFEKFVQLKQSPQDHIPGLGVGLTVARKLVELHAGRITVRSEGLGQGSEFLVSLPLGQTANPALGQTANPASSPAKPHPGPAPTTDSQSAATRRKILIVDDVPSASYMLGRLLQTLGQEVQSADSAISAISLAEQYQPELIISDITMPQIDGYELARRLRSHPQFQRTVLVALTGKDEDLDRARSHSAGFDYHLVKPISIDQLRDLLGSCQHENRPPGSVYHR